MSSQSDKGDGSPSTLCSAEAESIESIASIMEHLDKALDEAIESVSELKAAVPVEDVDEEKEDTRKMAEPKFKSPDPSDYLVNEDKSKLLHDVSHGSSLSFSDDGGDDLPASFEDELYDDELFEDEIDDDYAIDKFRKSPRILSALIHSSEEEEEEGESHSEGAEDDDEEAKEDEVDEDESYVMLAGNAGDDNDERDSVNSASLEAKTSPVVKQANGAARQETGAAAAANQESFEDTTTPTTYSRKPRNVGNTPAASRFVKPAFRGRRPPLPSHAVQRGERGPAPMQRPPLPLDRRNSGRPMGPSPMVPRRGGGMLGGGAGGGPKQNNNNPRGEAEDGSSLFISNWGFRSNLIDQNGNFQRATTDLKNYIVSYKSKYLYFFDLVNGRYPQYVRTLPNKMEIWRMSFNVYASGFSEYISHLGEIHCFYQMEMVDGELRWVYKDFNFYPNRMRYGFRVNTFDIADVHSRFVKFVCVRDNIIKQFPYVEIHHKVFIGKKFDNNVRNMLNRLKTVKRDLDY